MSLTYIEKLFPMNQFSVIREDGTRVYLFAVQYGPSSHGDSDYVVYTTKVKLFSKFDVYAACFDRSSPELKIWPIEDEATWLRIQQNLGQVKNAGELWRTNPAEVVAWARGSRAKDADKYPGAKLACAPSRRCSGLSQRERAQRDKKIFPDRRLMISDERGNRTGYDVILTAQLEGTGVNCVAYTDGRERDKTLVYASAYDITADEPVLWELEDESSWRQLEKLLEPHVKEIQWQNRI